MEGIQPLTEQITLLGQGNTLPDGGTKAKELTNPREMLGKSVLPVLSEVRKELVLRIVCGVC